MNSVSLAPSAVSNITAISINSTSLWLSWQQPDGDVDELVVLVFSSGAKIWEKTLHRNTEGVAVDQLTPGSAYQIVVKSRSGGLTNQSEIRTRTGETARQKASCSFTPSSHLRPTCSSGAGVPPLLDPVLLRRPRPDLAAPCWSLGELQPFAVRRLPADSQHLSGQGGGELQLPRDAAHSWKVVPSCADGGERRTDDRERL